MFSLIFPISYRLAEVLLQAVFSELNKTMAETLIFSQFSVTKLTQILKQYLFTIYWNHSIDFPSIYENLEPLIFS